MPITPTYPGVYVEEIPSGVRTITGVSTSVTAFIGNAKRGPIDKAVRILGFADYERRFGGLTGDSELSYAVRQFFSNGGSEAWIVRVAASPTTNAHKTLNHGATAVLDVTAVDGGASGENIRLLVDYETGNPGSTFNLSAIYSAEGEPSIVEKFTNLSMNSTDPRYVKTVVSGSSQLITVERNAAATGLLAGRSGTSASGTLDPFVKPDATHSTFRISVNGADFVTITLPAVGIIDGPSLVAKLNPLLTGATSAFDATSKVLTITSSLAGDERSSVRILAGLTNDASVILKLGPLNGGMEIDAAAAMRPDAVPVRGSLTGTSIVAATAITAAKMLISVDGGVPVEISMPAFANVGALAAPLEAAVRAINLASPAFRDFTVTLLPTGPNVQVVLASGTRGKGSSVAVFAGTPDLAAQLGLNPPASSGVGTDITLTGSTYTPFDPETNPFPTVIASRTNRTGIFALESVDLFNILCIPAVSDGATLAEAAAYCQERRAFLIADPPRNLTPDLMETRIKSPQVPKTNYGAIYYPWIKIAAATGALRSVPPSGTIAGVYARTDATRGVWKAPAGTDASLVGVQGADYSLTDRENGILNPRGVNCNRIFPVYGPVAWGARTLQGDNDFASEWKYVPVRRLALFIEESLFRGTQWVVFEPNDEPLWSQIRLNVGAFMQNLFRQGAFQGRTPRDAYLVKCDKDTTTQNDINLGIVNILVGFAPLKPAEFVFLKIQQLAGQIQV